MINLYYQLNTVHKFIARSFNHNISSFIQVCLFLIIGLISQFFLLLYFLLLFLVAILVNIYLFFGINDSFLYLLQQIFSILLECIFDLVCSFCRNLHEIQTIILSKFGTFLIRNFSSIYLLNDTQLPYHICFLPLQNTFMHFHSF